jgi:hypothetical protein
MAFFPMIHEAKKGGKISVILLNKILEGNPFGFVENSTTAFDKAA